MANVRTYYACQSVRLGEPSGSDAPGDTSTFTTINGIQSVGVTTAFNLDPVYQLGQLAQGDLYEDIPEVSISLTKALDGSTTIWNKMMGNGSLTQLSDKRSAVQLAIYPDTVTKATGSASICLMRPAYLSSINYNFPVDGNFTEEATILANSKVWSTAALDASPAASLANVQRRQSFDLTQSIFPTGSVGSGPFQSGSLPEGFNLQNVTVSLDLGREDIFRLGERMPFTKYIQFPVEVTSEFEIIVANGDKVEASDSNVACENPKSLADRSIKIVTCDGYTLDLGTKNKLNNVSTAGGDAGGDNVTYTFSYVTYDDVSIG